MLTQGVINAATEGKDHPCLWALEQYKKPAGALETELMNIFNKYIPEYSEVSPPNTVSLEAFILTRTQIRGPGVFNFSKVSFAAFQPCHTEMYTFLFVYVR